MIIYFLQRAFTSSLLPSSIPLSPVLHNDDALPIEPEIATESKLARGRAQTQDHNKRKMYLTRVYLVDGY